MCVTGLAVRRGEEKTESKDPDGLTSDDCQDFCTFEKRRAEQDLELSGWLPERTPGHPARTSVALCDRFAGDERRQ